MLGDVKPFRLCGNIYYVGSKRYSCHIIDTGDGLVMIDNGYEKNAAQIVESMAMLGFKPEDVKILLVSHEHKDHFDATPFIFTKEQMPKIYVGARGASALPQYFRPDVLMHDGDIIELGNTKILCRETPGHALGVISFFFDVEENGKTYRAGMFGGNGIWQMSKKYMAARGLTENQKQMFFDSIKMLRNEHVDVPLGNHPPCNRTLEKIAKLQTSGVNLFIDTSNHDWIALLDWREAQLKELIFLEELEAYVRDAGTYYLATTENGVPRVRPFGTVNLYRSKLHIQTGKSKEVSKQIKANPRAEICASKGSEWVRISCDLIEDDNVEARKAMLDAYPELRAMYDENDGNTVVYQMANATATFYSFASKPRTVKFGFPIVMA